MLSIIIPVYNSEKYLEECLTGVINQTLKDIEIICVNDGSTDNSLKILEKFAEQDSRIRIINQQNQGQGYARNTGLEAAAGDYIGFIDSDDFISNDFYEKLYSYKDDIILSVCRQYLENGKLRNKNFKIKDKNSLIMKNCNIYNKIYRKEFLTNNDIKFYGKTNPAEDNYFSVKAILRADSIKIIKGGTYFYRVVEGSTIHKTYTKEGFEILNIMKEIKSFNPSAKILDLKINQELNSFYKRLDKNLKSEFKIEALKMFPNVKLKEKFSLKLFR